MKPYTNTHTYTMLLGLKPTLLFALFLILLSAVVVVNIIAQRVPMCAREQNANTFSYCARNGCGNE